MSLNCLLGFQRSLNQVLYASNSADHLPRSAPILQLVAETRLKTETVWVRIPLGARKFNQLIKEVKMFIVDKFPNSRVSPRGIKNGNKWDWVRIFDGHIWFIEAGKDFNGSPQSGLDMTRNKAYKHGYRIKTERTDNGFYVQCLNPKEGPGVSG